MEAKDEHRVSHFLAVGFICDMLLYCVGNSKKERTQSRQFIQPATKEGTNIYVARGWAPAGRYFAAAWTRLDCRWMSTSDADVDKPSRRGRAG